MGEDGLTTNSVWLDNIVDTGEVREKAQKGYSLSIFGEKGD